MPTYSGISQPTLGRSGLVRSPLSQGQSLAVAFAAHDRRINPLIMSFREKQQADIIESSYPRKRGRPAKYASPEEKARADVENERARRQREAHERRERLHAQFYGERRDYRARTYANAGSPILPSPNTFLIGQLVDRCTSTPRPSLPWRFARLHRRLSTMSITNPTI